MSKTGFTLIEILIVIGMIAILAAVVIVAINPARQFAQSRNTQRWSNVNTILNAVHQYAVDNNGLLPAEITTSVTEICKSSTATTTCATAALINLKRLVFDEKYLVELPIDPSCPTGCDAEGIGYEIVQTANGRVTVSAPNAELGETIEVKR